MLSPNEFVYLFVQNASKARTGYLLSTMDLKYLPDDQQATIVDMEKQVLALTATLLKRVHPNIAPSEYNMYALMLITTINSMDLWRKPDGKYSATELAKKYTDIFLNGFVNIVEANILKPE